jgi:hypothetical protein
MKIKVMFRITYEGTSPSVSRGIEEKIYQSIELDELVTVVADVFAHRAFL